MVASCNAVLEVLTVAVMMQFVVRNGDLSVLGHGERDLIAAFIQRNDVEYDGIFSVEECKFFECRLFLWT